MYNIRKGQKTEMCARLGINESFLPGPYSVRSAMWSRLKQAGGKATTAASADLVLASEAFYCSDRFIMDLELNVIKNQSSVELLA